MVRRRSDCRKGPSGGAQTRKENEHEKDAIRAIEDGYEKYAMEEHDRSMSLLSVMMQVDTFLAGFLLFSLTGQKETDEIQAEERVQVILQTVTFGVFLSAIIHTAVLMMSTGLKHILTWYDPIWPGVSSALGIILLLVTVADAVFIELQPGDDIYDPDYWLLVLLGLFAPILIAGVVIFFQMR